MLTIIIQVSADEISVFTLKEDENTKLTMVVDVKEDDCNTQIKIIDL